jgi:hypothetical protein
LREYLNFFATDFEESSQGVILKSLNILTAAQLPEALDAVLLGRLQDSKNSHAVEGWNLKSHPPDKPKYAFIWVTLQETGCPPDSFTACSMRAQAAICAPAD